MPAGLEFLYISGSGIRAKKNQGAKKTRSKTRGKGRKRKGDEGEGRKGVKKFGSHDSLTNFEPHKSVGTKGGRGAVFLAPKERKHIHIHVDICIIQHNLDLAFELAGKGDVYSSLVC